MMSINMEFAIHRHREMLKYRVAGDLLHESDMINRAVPPVHIPKLKKRDGVISDACTENPIFCKRKLEMQVLSDRVW